MATFKWAVTQMDCYPQAEGEENVAFNVHWTLVGTQDTYSGNIYSTCPVTYVAGTAYTPFEDLTQDQVLGWIWANGVDKDSAEAAVQAQIDAQITPTVVQPALPWAV